MCIILNKCELTVAQGLLCWLHFCVCIFFSIFFFNFFYLWCILRGHKQHIAKPCLLSRKVLSICLFFHLLQQTTALEALWASALSCSCIRDPQCSVLSSKLRAFVSHLQRLRFCSCFSIEVKKQVLKCFLLDILAFKLPHPVFLAGIVESFYIMKFYARFLGIKHSVPHCQFPTTGISTLDIWAWKLWLWWSRLIS